MATYSTGAPAAALDTPARAQFVLRTYTHLFGAILLFAGIEYALFMTGAAETIASAMLSTSWLLVLGGFVVVGMLASSTAHRATSPAAQYAALVGYVVAEALIFVPLLFVAAAYAGPDVINKAAWVTLLGFAGLTAVAFVSRKDFSFLGSLLRWGGIMALVLIVVGVLFGFELGTWFSVAMIALAGAAILYNTSNILHTYPEDRYVAASLELFASVALMFWYVLRLFMSRD
jgi:uncharacterized protein